ncbi:60s ribosomal protein l27a-3 [Nicotiana attenuata]|uniref:60s ribosomal protein l27a-3 n=1 Tax=Nicotiana attenuata TaxID=49451 RepID=A0A314KJJ9_NICAT|nr:60s ribosomal protein l27a-3 [Nicotiana attenuata]
MKKSNRKMQHMEEWYQNRFRTFHSSPNLYEVQISEREQWVSGDQYANHQYSDVNTHLYRESSGVEHYYENPYAYTYSHPYSQTCPYQVPHTYHFNGNYPGSYLAQLGDGSVVLVTTAVTVPTYRDQQTVSARFRNNWKKIGYLNACHGRIGKHRKHHNGKGNAAKMHHIRILFDKYLPSYFRKVGMRYFHKRNNLSGTSSPYSDVEEQEDEEEASVNYDECALLEMELEKGGSSVEDQLFDESSHTNETLEVSSNEVTNIQFQLFETSLALNYVSELNGKLIPGDCGFTLIQNDREEIEDKYLDIVNSRNHVDTVFDESLLKVEESLPKQTTLSEGQEVIFKPPITGIKEQGSDTPCFWSEGFGNIFGGIKGVGSSHVDSLHRKGQFNFPANHFNWNPLVICFVVYHGDIKFGLFNVDYPALGGLGASVIAPWMWRLDCWLWDYLRRCGACDFLFSFSSGVDNFSAVVIVLSMCQLVRKETAKGHEQATSDAFQIGHHTEGQFATGSEEYILWMLITDDSGVTCTQLRRISAETWELKIKIKMKDVEEQVNTNSLVGVFPLYSLLYQHEEIKTISIHDWIDKKLTGYRYILLFEYSVAAKARRAFESFPLPLKKSTFFILIVVSRNYLLTIGVDGIWYESMIEVSLTEDDNSVATSLFYGLEKQTNKSILGFDDDTSTELSPTFIDSTSMKNRGISRLKRKHTGELHHFQIQLDFHVVTALLLDNGDRNILEGVIQIARRMQQYFMVYQISYIHV